MPSTRIQPRNHQWAVYAALALTIAGIVYQGGYLANQVAQNDRRITKLEASVDKVNAIDVRTARMEGKLDMILPKDPRR